MARLKHTSPGTSTGTRLDPRRDADAADAAEAAPAHVARVRAHSRSFGHTHVLRNIDPEAQEESLKARERFRGKLTYQGTNKEKGENVGSPLVVPTPPWPSPR